MINKDITGIFDSGVGGLSVLTKLIPLGGNYIYFGDTKNLPYGNKTQNEIIDFTRNIINFFIQKGANRVIMACNTSSALAYDTLNQEFGTAIKIHPLIQTAAPYIAQSADVIGVMATQATVKSQAYTKEIKKHNPDIKVYELACPDFVKIVENRLYDKKESVEYIKKHLEFLIDRKCTKIVLGCTHYPYLMPVLKRYAPEEMFIDPALYMKNILKTNFIQGGSKIEYYVSKDPETFKKNASVFININEKIQFVKTEEPIYTEV